LLLQKKEAKKRTPRPLFFLFRRKEKRRTQGQGKFFFITEEKTEKRTSRPVFFFFFNLEKKRTEVHTKTR
jgi:hypothetical protein